MQSQVSLYDQLRLLREMANANGLYDAADWLGFELDYIERKQRDGH